jgi:hypothetical protein
MRVPSPGKHPSAKPGTEGMAAMPFLMEHVPSPPVSVLTISFLD